MNRLIKLSPWAICTFLAGGSCFAGSPFVANYDGQMAVGPGVAPKPGANTSQPDKSASTDKDDAVRDRVANNPIFAFSSEDQGVGDAAVNVLGDGVEYKINAVNYNLYLGDSLVVPFQLYYGDFASDESPEDSNKQKLVDPTQGLALQFPFIRPFGGTQRFCSFSSKPGRCLFGADITLRGVRLNETDEAGEVREKSVFGASASVKSSMVFPVFQPNDKQSQAGALGISIGARYFYHNTKHQDLLFGEAQDPEGKSVDFKKGFGAAVAEAELGIFNYFKIRLEYFRPFNNRDALDDVFKASVVVTPKK